MPKSTLKHLQENGVLATRTTARTYTVVLLRKYNRDLLIAEAKAAQPALLKSLEARAREDFAEYSLYLTKQPGDQIPYNRNQGGYVRGQVRTYPMPDYLPKLAREAMERHGATELSWVADYLVRAQREHALHLDQLAAYSEDWEVVSWHGSAGSAKPSGYRSPSTQYKVESINNGVRA